MARIAHDFYPTPVDLCTAIVSRLGVIHREVLEPSAGSGNFVRAIRKAYPASHIRAVELRAEEAPVLRMAGADVVHTQDWLGFVYAHPFGSPVTCVGNPPFNQAESHVLAALDKLPVGSTVTMLLRMSFLGSKGRTSRLWSRGQLKSLTPVVERPQFDPTAKGTDNSEYAVYSWQVGFTGPCTLLPHLWWKQPNP